jgi:L-arabinonolactonase
MRLPIQIKGISDAHCWTGYVATSGEAPIWDARREKILWVDIRGCAVLEGDWREGTIRVLPVPDLPAFVAPAHDGSLIVGGRAGIVRVDRDTGTVEPVSAPAELVPDFRFNDGAIDPKGRLVIGSTALDADAAPSEGALYVLDGAEWRVLFHGLGIVNGLAFAPDGRTMFVSDSQADRARIFAFDYDPEAAAVSAGRSIADFRANGWAGLPDGAAIDADGGYWIAALGGGALLRLNPDGTLDRRIDLPFAKVSKVAFVGPELDRMAVTSFAAPASAGEIQSGMLLTFDAGAKGAPCRPLSL